LVVISSNIVMPLAFPLSLPVSEGEQPPHARPTGAAEPLLAVGV